jgi:hypothetical protein
MMDNALQRLKELDHERASIVTTVKSEALARANEAIAELRALGFHYRIVEDGATKQSTPRRSATNGAGKGVPSGAPCPVCTFKTDPPHDARKHRAQGKRKRAFTAKQLEELGLTKV